MQGQSTGELAVSPHESITSTMGHAEKPSIEEVLKYAKPIIRKFIGEKAKDLPHEQREEIEQTANLRILQAYDRLDPDAGWRSFVYNHARGAVLDYQKFGCGFEEAAWSLAQEEEVGSRSLLKLRDRVPLVATNGEDAQIEDIAAREGVSLSFGDEELQIRINWELVARLASTDIELHVFAKYLKGYSIEEMAPVFGLSRARVGQLLEAFQERLDSPRTMNEPWNRQIAFALGAGRAIGLLNCEKDQSEVYGWPIGTDLAPVDLDSLIPAPVESDNQLAFDLGGA